MTDWLLDTDALSELRRPGPDRKVVGFVASRPIETFVTRDTGGFDRTGAPMLDPWTSP